MSTVKFLEEIRDLIDAGWTQGYGARDVLDNRVHIHSKEAVKFCLAGAMYKVSDGHWLRRLIGRTRTREEWKVRDALEDAIRDIRPPYVGLIGFNDMVATTQEEVLEVLDEALRREKAKHER